MMGRRNELINLKNEVFLVVLDNFNSLTFHTQGEMK